MAEDRILTSGFSHGRARELIIRDTRNLATPLHTRELDVSAGILVPLYDPDTKMVFLTGKGDRYILTVILSVILIIILMSGTSTLSRWPTLPRGLSRVSDILESRPRYSFMTFMTFINVFCQGGCLVPKRAMDVMKGEVARLLQLADHSIVPITWQVPR